MTLTEQKEEMRQDMIIEAKARRDMDFAIALIDKDDKLIEHIKYIRKVCTKLRLYDWEVSPSNLVKHLEVGG